jgi:ComF family protein
VEPLSGDICSRCGDPISDLNPERNGYCRNCPTGLVHFASARAAVAYSGAVKELILALKFRFEEHLAPLLADFLEPVFEEEFRDRVDFLVPVPLHWTRRRWREFNQSALLARALAGKKGLKVREDLLRRVRRTRPQSRTSGQGAKRRNVRGAFRAFLPRSAVGSRVLLIDDVYTSGNTVNECARVLQEEGANEVHVLTVARTLSGG